jgi:hypothetical protein
MKRRGMGINWSCMHTKYSCMRIEVTSCVSIWMDYAVAASPVSCVESVKNFQLQLVAEKARMVYVRKYRCTGAVMGLQFKLLRLNQNKHTKPPVETKKHRVFTRNTHATLSILCKFTWNSSLGSFALFVCFEKCHFTSCCRCIRRGMINETIHKCSAALLL